MPDPHSYPWKHILANDTRHKLAGVWSGNGCSVDSMRYNILCRWLFRHLPMCPADRLNAFHTSRVPEGTAKISLFGWLATRRDWHTQTRWRRLGARLPSTYRCCRTGCRGGRGLRISCTSGCLRERPSGGLLRLVFRLAASTMEQDAGLLDAMLGKSAGRAPSYAAEDDARAVQSPAWRVHELLQSPACSRAWLTTLRSVVRDGASTHLHR